MNEISTEANKQLFSNLNNVWIPLIQINELRGGQNKPGAVQINKILRESSLSEIEDIHKGMFCVYRRVRKRLMRSDAVKHRKLLATNTFQKQHNS